MNKNLPNRTCPVCEASYKPKEKDQKVCSLACSRVRYKQAWQDKSEANKKESV